MKLAEIMELTEAKSLGDYVTMLNEIQMFLTLNTAMIQQYAKDSASVTNLAEMQKQFRSPILNGKTISDLMSETGLPTVKNLKVIPHLLKWTYQFLNYVKPRIEKRSEEHTS